MDCNALTLLEDKAILGQGVAWLAARDDGMARIATDLPLPPLRRKPQGFASLLNTVTGQQVSTASAAAIWGRIEGAGLVTPEAVLAAGEEGLRAVGLSRPKIRYALAIAASGMDFAGLAALPDDEVIARLVALPGIGRWSAEIYATTALGRADILPAGDLALQEAARLLYRLDARPTELAFRAMGQAWSPWRGVAARLLWSFYRAEKNKEGLA